MQQKKNQEKHLFDGFNNQFFQNWLLTVYNESFQNTNVPQATESLQKDSTRFGMGN